MTGEMEDVRRSKSDVILSIQSYLLAYVVKLLFHFICEIILLDVILQIRRDIYGKIALLLLFVVEVLYSCTALAK